MSPQLCSIVNGMPARRNPLPPSYDAVIFINDGIIIAHNSIGDIISGDTDIATVLQAVHDYLSDGDTIKFIGNQTFSFPAGSSLTFTKSLKIFGNGTIIDCSLCDRTVMNWNVSNGYSTSTVLVSVNVTAGDSSITVADASSFSADDYIKIVDDTSISDGGTSFKQGQILKIKSIAGNIITVNGIVFNDYAVASNAKIRKLDILNGITISGFTFIGPGINTTPVFLDLCAAENFTFSNNVIKNWGHTAVSLTDVIDSKVTGNIFSDIYLAGYGYSVSIYNACDNIEISSNAFRNNGRHYVNTGARTGSYLYGGFPYTINVLHNYFSSPDATTPAIHTHNPINGPFVVVGNMFVNCAYGGINLVNSPATISDNLFYRCCMGVHIEKDVTESPVNINDNVFISTILGGGTAPTCIFVSSANVSVKGNRLDAQLTISSGVDNVDVVDNTWYLAGSTSRPIYLYGAVASHITSAYVIGNRIISCASSYALYALYVDNLFIIDNSVISSGIIEVRNSTNSIVDGNLSVSSPSSAMRFNAITVLARITNNIIISSGNKPIYFDGVVDAAVPVHCYDNHFHGVGSISFAGYTNIKWKRNTAGYITEFSATGLVGNGVEQTIPHGLSEAPRKVSIIPLATGVTISNVWADATNIYCTVTNLASYNASAEV